jgi:hypothetical protein
MSELIDGLGPNGKLMVVGVTTLKIGSVSWPNERPCDSLEKLIHELTQLNHEGEAKHERIFQFLFYYARNPDESRHVGKLTT